MIGYLDLWTGLSGDMMVGALIGAGWPEEEARRTFGQLGMPEAVLTVERRMRHGIMGHGIKVEAVREPPERGMGEIRRLLERSSLDDAVRDASAAMLQKMAEVEAEIHGVDPDRVHLHELGAIDSIADVVLTVAGLRALGVERLICGAIPVTRGSVGSAHGRMPVPAPATLSLLRGWPIRWLPLEGEWLTPTGALILSTLCLVEDPPPMHLRAVGIGAGSRELQGTSNIVRLLLGDEPSTMLTSARRPAGAEDNRRPESGELEGVVSVIETDLDDQDPRQIAWVVTRLEASGALEVLQSPAGMKKGRMGVVLTILCRPEDERRLGSLLLRESSTLGIRVRREVRRELRRWFTTVETPHGQVRVKWTAPGGRARPRPEFDDLAALAAAADLPIWEIERSVLESLPGVVPQVPSDSGDSPP